MKPYQNRTGKSGIVAYDYDETRIFIEFHDGKTYEYSIARIGSSNLAMLKQRADFGEGLNSAINKNPTIKNGGVRIR